MWFAFRPIARLEDEDDLLRGRSVSQDGTQGVGRLGMQIFLASLTFIFGASILLYVILMNTQEAPTIGVLGFAPIRIGLGISTAILILSSITLRKATTSIAKRDDRAGLGRWLGATLLLGWAFVASQSWVWLTIARSGLKMDATNRHAAFFVILTVLHALHVAGGIVRLHQVTARAKRGVYSKDSHEQVSTAAMYWHYLDLVWMFLLAAILLLSR